MTPAREILVRSLTSNDRLNRDCLVTEVMRQGETTTRVIRRCTYHVESRITVPALEDSVKWAQRLDPVPTRQVYVTKEFDPRTGNEHVTHKVLGYFYVVMEREVVCIGYRHVLTMVVEAPEPCE